MTDFEVYLSLGGVTRKIGHARSNRTRGKETVLFEYADKKAAEKKANDLTASSRAHHFIQLVKEAITE